MTCSSFLIPPTAESMIYSQLFCLQPSTNTAFFRPSLSPFPRLSSGRLSLYSIEFSRFTFNRQGSAVTKVGRIQDATIENDVVQGYAAAVSAREPDKVQEDDIKKKAYLLGAHFSESVATHVFDRGLPMGLAAGISSAAAIFVMLVLGLWAKSTQKEGSVSDLVKRGQLRSDRKANSQPLKYDDPFNNPMVKAGSKNPLVRMCGRIFRSAPVTLTEEKVLKHQNRRLQAYQWKRPVVFLNEGDSIPNGVDPEEVRWIPSNHPFATTTNYIDEEAAQKNVYQTRGVPARVRAEHEAMRRKMMEAAQKDTEPWSSQINLNTNNREPPASECSQLSTENSASKGEEINKMTNKIEVLQMANEQISESHEFAVSRLRTIDGSGQEHVSNRTQETL